MNPIHALLRRVAGVPALQRLSHWAYDMRVPANRRAHPFDLRHGVAAGGQIPGFLLRARGLSADLTAYAGCIPSALTAALDTLPPMARAAFVDLGCGKGRALTLARTYPFASLRGLEMNPILVEAARRNAAQLQRRDPTRPAIEILEADATAPAPVAGDAVYFLYHPFGEESVRRLCAHLIANTAPGARLFVIYENPVHGEVFDSEPGFRRWFAAQAPHKPEEIGFGPDESEGVLVWTNADAGESPHPTAGRIVITKPGWRAEIHPDRTSPPVDASRPAVL